MTDEAKPKRGGARRGPYSGKKMTFTTKLTEGTMDRLTAAAKASEMSVSQKGEAAILRGLDAEDDFHLHFAPALASFERKMTLSMPPRDQEVVDHRSWRAAASRMVDALAEDLRRAIVAVPAPSGSDATEDIEAENKTIKTGASSRRTGRHLDID